VSGLFTVIEYRESGTGDNRKGEGGRRRKKKGGRRKEEGGRRKEEGGRSPARGLCDQNDGQVFGLTICC
jgi:hypothetical protein